MSDDQREQEDIGWAVVELLGHRRLGAYVTVQEIAGHAFLRLDVPGGDETTGGTQYVNPSSLYALTPTTREIAEGIAAVASPPVNRWDLRRAESITHGTPTALPTGDEDGEDGPPWGDESPF